MSNVQLSVPVEQYDKDVVTSNIVKMPTKNKSLRAKPVLITSDQRANNKIKVLQNENYKLRQRIERMESLWSANNPPTNNGGEIPIKPNKFQPLMVDDMDDDVDTSGSTLNATGETFDSFKQSIKRKNEAESGTPERRTKNVKITNIGTNTVKNVVENSQVSKKTLTKKLVKPPPLHIHNQTVKDSVELMKGAKVEKFEIRRVSNDKHSIIVNTMDDYEKTNQVLKEVKTQYFTYTPKSLKVKSLVLKGLTEDEDIEDLKTSLEDNDGIKIEKIIQMKSKRKDEIGRKLPLYIVQYQPETKMSSVLNVKILNYQRVSWEHLKKQNDVMQCRKCQRFGHVASNCNLLYRCVKCSSQHNPGECVIKDKIEQNCIYCINCQKMGHPASFKGCPVYQRMLEKLRNKIKENRTKTPRTFETIPVNIQNGTYADMLKPKEINQLSIENLALKMNKMAQTIQQQSEQIAQLLKVIGSL